MAAVVHDAIDASRTLGVNVNPTFISPPGVGKSAFARHLGATASRGGERLFESTILANLSQKSELDMGGAVTPDGKRVLVDDMRDVVERPTLLVLDELFRTPKAVWDASMTMLSDRIVANRELHAGTFMLAFSNPPEGSVPSHAQLDRLWMATYRPTRAGYVDFLKNRAEPPALDAGENQVALPSPDVVRGGFHQVCRIAAACLACEPSLVQDDPPDGSLDKWSSRRSFEAGLAMYTIGRLKKRSMEMLFKSMAGRIGVETATVFFAILEAKKNLPTVDDVLTDAVAAGRKVAALPRHAQMAAFSLVPSVASRDAFAAWVFIDQLREAGQDGVTVNEIQAAAATMAHAGRVDAASRYAADGATVMSRINAAASAGALR